MNRHQNLPAFRRVGIGLVLIAGLVAAGAVRLAAAQDVFSVRFSREVHPQPYTGRVYVLFSRIQKEPRNGPDWFHPEQFVAQDVRNWKPDEPLLFTPKAAESTLAYPVPFAQMSLAGYKAQAVVRFNPMERRIGDGPGNGYSQVVALGVTVGGSKQEDRPVELNVSKLVQEQVFPESRWCKLLRFRSQKLSEFHGRDVYLQASVLLPASYFDQPERRYPTILTIPGFGGTHFFGASKQPVSENNPGGVEFLRLMLDPSCPLGHHVFADSANNGPVGTALVEEFLPEFNRQFRSVADPRARFLTGHSSGGWSSLWLQVTYPETFNGTWSTSPDPVDFRDFQRIDLYAPNQNMYVDAQGQTRPLARHGRQVLLTYKGFAEMEWVLGQGGQLHSFEAVFSAKGNDGRPRLLWDRATGTVDAEVAKSWERYDIRLILERNWSSLAPKLSGKLHVIMGDADTFYLEGATVLLKQSLEKLGSDAVIEIHPGKDHFTLVSRELFERIRGEMATRYLQYFPAK